MHKKSPLSDALDFGSSISYPAAGKRNLAMKYNYSSQSTGEGGSDQIGIPNHKDPSDIAQRNYTGNTTRYIGTNNAVGVPEKPI